MESKIIEWLTVLIPVLALVYTMYRVQRNSLEKKLDSKVDKTVYKSEKEILNQRFERVDQQFKNFGDKIEGLEKAHGQTFEFLKETMSEIKEVLKEFKTEFRSDVTNLKSELKDDVKSVQNRLDSFSDNFNQKQ